MSSSERAISSPPDLSRTDAGSRRVPRAVRTCGRKNGRVEAGRWDESNRCLSSDKRELGVWLRDRQRIGQMVFLFGGRTPKKSSKCRRARLNVHKCLHVTTCSTGPEISLSLTLHSLRHSASGRNPLHCHGPFHPNIKHLEER